MGGWVGTRAGLDIVHKPLAPNGNRTSDCPARSLVATLATLHLLLLMPLNSFPCPSIVTYPTKGTLHISGRRGRKRLPEADTADAHNPPHTANFLRNFMSCGGLHGRQHDK